MWKYTEKSVRSMGLQQLLLFTASNKWSSSSCYLVLPDNDAVDTPNLVNSMKHQKYKRPM